MKSVWNLISLLSIATLVLHQHQGHTLEQCELSDVDFEITIHSTYSRNEEVHMYRHRYRGVIENENDVCIITRKMQTKDTEELLVDFAANLTLFKVEDGRLFGIKRDFAIDEQTHSCVVLYYNRSRHLVDEDSWLWKLRSCNNSFKRFNMNESRAYWNETGSNNIFPALKTTHEAPTSTAAAGTSMITGYHLQSEIALKTTHDESSITIAATGTSIITGHHVQSEKTCDFLVDSKASATELENQLQNYSLTAKSDCNVGSEGEVFQASVRSSSNCSDEIQLNYCNVQCSQDTTSAKLALAEFLADSSEISRYMTKRHQYFGHDQTIRKTLLPPVGNRLLSISIISPTGSKNGSVGILFSCKLPLEESFRDHAYDLTFNSNENGLLRTTYRYINHQSQCAFIDEDTMIFKTSGCKCTLTGDVAYCSSNHTTVFAVLLSVDTVEISTSVKIVSIATQSVSILFLFVTFVILIHVRKRVRGDRIPIQINLTISLLLLNFCLLWEDIAVQIPPFCRAIAVLTQFFVLSTALWMMNEANLLFIKTSDWAFSVTKRRKIVMVTMLIGWGISSIITIVAVVIGFANDFYMEKNFFNFANRLAGNATESRNGLEYEHCWLNSQNGMRWAAIGPVVFILTYNLIIAVRAVVFVYRKRIEAEQYKPSEQNDESKRRIQQLKNIIHSLKAILLLLPVLGLPWIMLLAANSGVETLKLSFMYINAVINGLQGVFVFIIYCVVDRKVKEATIKDLSSLGDTWPSFSLSRFQPSRP